MSKQAEFASRRKKLIQAIGQDSVAILFASKECQRNGDVHFPFRQNSNFYYFTGFNEPEAVAIFLPERKGGEYVLFNQPRDPQMERWVGHRVGQEMACQQYGVHEAFDIALLDEKVIELLSGRKHIFYEIGKQTEWDRKVTAWIPQLKAINRRSDYYPTTLSEIGIYSNEFRLIKSAEELHNLREAADVSAIAHQKLMECCHPGMYEYELEALFNYEIRMKGCQSLAYPSIVGGGANACILHYIDNNDQLKSGDLVLVDAGGEYNYYAADITRTFPVNGKFSDNQKAIYELVLNAQLAVLQVIKPGIPWGLLQETAVKEITKGLIQLDILKMSLHEALEKKAYLEFYMHNIGHWLGMDVHDAGAYVNGKGWRLLEKGMVLTVEPGLYLSASDQLDPKWHNIGVRIEDDVLVTEKGCEVLTKGAPKTVADIEKLMSTRRRTI